MYKHKFCKDVIGRQFLKFRVKNILWLHLSREYLKVVFDVSGLLNFIDMP